MRAALAAAAALLLSAGCTSDSEPEATSTTSPASAQAPVETPIALGEPFTITGPHYTADITIERFFIPALCGSSPNGNAAVEADVAVQSGDGTRDVLNTGTVRERTADGYIKKERVVSQVCDGIEELDAANAQTGDKYRGVIWLADDVDTASEILINAPTGDGSISEVFVLNLGGLNIQEEAAAEAEGPEADAPAGAGAGAPVVAAEPTVIECLQGTPGPARWSDGTTRYSEWCYQSRGGPAHSRNESNSGLYGPNHQELLRRQAEAIQQGRATGDAQMEAGCRAGNINADTCAMAGY